MQANNPRLLAVDVLTKVFGHQGYSNLTLDAVIEKNHLEPRDAALLTTIVYGTIQHQLTLDFYLAPFIKGKKLDLWVQQVLTTAIFQMVYLDKVPERAILFDAAEIAKKKGHIGIVKLVNGILRKAQRDGFLDVATITDPIERLSISSSTPRWLVEKLIDQLGQPKTTQILETINKPAHGSIRVNTTQTTTEALQEMLIDDFPDIAPSPISPVGLVASHGHLAGSAGFKAGLYTMQDESSMLVAPSLALEPGDQVLDACAAPGGKTTHIAQYLDPDLGGHVTALDLHPHKVRLIETNAKRLGLEDRISAQAMDARKVNTAFAAESFDKILVDAPCSGLGLIRRKPEIKYEKQLSDLIHLQAIQLDILDSVAPTLKIGGRLTYSTCTMVKEENQDVVAAFLQRHPNFKQVAVPTDLPLSAAHSAPALQIFPDDYQTDGFFIASLTRIA